VSEMDEMARAKFDARLMVARRVGSVLAMERGRILDRIELMLFQAETTETADVLVGLAAFILDGDKA
jgi:hypothetical protein